MPSTKHDVLRELQVRAPELFVGSKRRAILLAVGSTAETRRAELTVAVPRGLRVDALLTVRLQAADALCGTSPTC